MPAHFKLNPKAQENYRHAMAELADLMGKDTPEGLQELLKLSSRRFTRNVADITPPASGKANIAAKKAGEGAIVADLLKLALPVVGTSRKQAREAFNTAEQLMAAHTRAFSGSARVNARNRKEKLLVHPADFQQVAKSLQSRVGWLAAGLNAAAEKLGFKLPAFIARHGQKYGAIEVKFTASKLLIRVIQNVPYTNRVQGYAARWASAFNREIRTIQKQMGVLRDKAYARASRHLRR